MWARMVLLLHLCLVNGESDGDEFAFVRYMKCVAPSDEADEVMNCFRLQWTTSGSGEKKTDLDREGR